MTDEKFTFIEDLREKKKTATGAHHKRTHCGKGGAVRFPSDYMTKKEREAMNGEVKSYKLNDPMSWAEFKAMPADIKIAYIKALRKRYNVSDTKIAEMFGTCQVNFSSLCRRLGIQSARKSKEAWDEDGWCAWVNGVPVKAEDEAVTFTQGKCFEFEVDDVDGLKAAAEAAREAVSEKCDEEVLEQEEKCDRDEIGACGDFVWFRDGKGMAFCKLGKADSVAEEAQPAVPGWGQMELEGTVEECAATLRMLLVDKRVKLTVSWAVM